MIVLAFVCLICGTLLGTRFKVAVLLPAMLATMAAVLSFGIIDGQKASIIVFSQVIAIGALQLGYLSTAVLGAILARKLYRPDGGTVHDSR